MNYVDYLLKLIGLDKRSIIIIAVGSVSKYFLFSKFIYLINV